MPDAWGLSFLPTLPFGFAPEAPSDDRELISLNPPVPEGSGAGRTGEGMLGEGLFDAAATGIFVGGPRRDSPKPERWQEPAETLHLHFMAHALHSAQVRVFFGWDTAAGIWRPYLYNESAAALGGRGTVALHNLHIHSKEVELYLSHGATVSILPTTVADGTLFAGGKGLRKWERMEIGEAFPFAWELWAEWKEMSNMAEGTASASLHLASLSLETLILFAASASDGRALFLMSVPVGKGRARGRGRSVWRLVREDDEVDVRGGRGGWFRAPALVRTPSVGGRGGQEALVVWSECEGRDSAGQGGGGGGQGRANCVGWGSALTVSSNVSHDLHHWSEPVVLGEGAVAGEPTVSRNGRSMHVPFVTWEQVVWSSGFFAPSGTPSAPAQGEWRRIYRVRRFCLPLCSRESVGGAKDAEGNQGDGKPANGFAGFSAGSCAEHAAAAVSGVEDMMSCKPVGTPPSAGKDGGAVVVPGTTFGQGVKILIPPGTLEEDDGNETDRSGGIMSLLVASWYGVSLSQSVDKGLSWGPPAPFFPHGRHKDFVAVKGEKPANAEAQFSFVCRPGCEPSHLVSAVDSGLPDHVVLVNVSLSLPSATKRNDMVFSETSPRETSPDAKETRAASDMPGRPAAHTLAPPVSLEVKADCIYTKTLYLHS